MSNEKFIERLNDLIEIHIIFERFNGDSIYNIPTTYQYGKISILINNDLIKLFDILKKYIEINYHIETDNLYIDDDNFHKQYELQSYERGHVLHHHSITYDLNYFKITIKENGYDKDLNIKDICDIKFDKTKIHNKILELLLIKI
jgi:hypothetical protein